MSCNSSRILRWSLTLVILAFLLLFAKTIDWAAAWISIRTASLPLVALTVFVNFLSVALKGVRWWLFLRPAGSPSLALAIRATIAGAGLNNVLVANGGDAARVVFVSRATGVPSATVLATLALERIFDPVGFVILLVYGVLAFSLPPALEKWRIPAEVALVVIAGLLCWLVYASRKAPRIDASVVRVRAPAGFWPNVKAYLAGFANSMRTLASGPRFAAALILSMLAWIAQILTFQLAAAAAHVAIPAAGSLAGLLAINLGLLIRATPGNVGFFQFVYALATEPFGVARDAAIAVSLLIQTIQIIPMTLLGVALAPEFIFGRAEPRIADGDAVARAATDESGASVEKGEKFSGTSRKP